MTTTKKQKPKTRFIVTKTVGNNPPADCGYANYRETGLHPDLTGSNGVLVIRPNNPTVFKGEKSALRAIGKTAKTIRTLRGSLLDGWKKLEFLLEPGSYDIRHFVQ